MIEIIPQLYISDIFGANDPDLIQKNNITHVISLGCEADISENILNLKYLNIKDLPDQIIIHTFDPCVKFIDEAMNHPSIKHNILVHCYYGQSRSASVVIAYLVENSHSKLNLNDAIDYLKAKKNDICINPGFLSQVNIINSFYYSFYLAYF